ncbi:hypothetical protein [Anaerosporobacter faecicola]|uniref:hypothetical protein n=1 Tax=Anaerosporobacter faecicola TaxID=2718714 RepID=UPI001438B884|nr:hypothetical protein [Anaerosporobacter faecicola]
MNVKYNGLGSIDHSTQHLEVATGKQKTVQEKRMEEEEKKAAQGNTLRATDLNLTQDIPAMKKMNAKKEAMKKLGDVFSSQLKTDNEMATRAEHMEELEQQAQAAQQEIDKIDESKAALAKEYEGNEQDPEYQSKMLELDKSKEEFTSRLNSARSEKEGESMTINAIHLALLKEDPMVGAQKEADKIMDSANKEFANALLNEAKDAIDEKLEKQMEEAKEKKEEKEEEEAKQVEREKEQEQLQNVHDNTKDPLEVKVENNDVTDTSDMIQTAEITHGKIQSEIKNLLKTQQLVEEDLKGLEVDQQL